MNRFAKFTVAAAIGLIAAGESQAQTSFWRIPYPGKTPPQPVSYTPVIINPRFYNGRLYFQSAGSFIQEGAELRVQVPFSSAESRFRLRYDSSYLFFVANVTTQAFPPGSIRILTLINPSGQMSAAVPLHRPR
jgi:hypothetical protein